MEHESTLMNSNDIQLTEQARKALFEQNHPDLKNIIVKLLSEHSFDEITLHEQVNWLFDSFQAVVNHGLNNAVVVKSLVEYHARRLFSSPNLNLSDACRLLEAIHGLNWVGAVSLFDMRGYNRAGIQPFYHYLKQTQSGSKINTSSHHQNQLENLNIVYMVHYADMNRGNALGPMMKDLIINHTQQSVFDITCFCVQWADQRYIDELVSAGVRVRVIPQEISYERLDELKQVLGEANPDVIISDVASPVATWLYSQRVARLQMYLDPGYPHWNIPELDWVLLPGKSFQSGFDIPRNRASSVRIAITDQVFPNIKDACIDNSDDFEFSFGLFTRLVKVNSELLHILSELMATLPEAKLLIVGSGNSDLIANWLSESTFSARVTFINQMVELQCYKDRVKVFLDTFPFVGGLACREMMSYGIPVVSMLAGEWDELLKEQRDLTTLASSHNEYLQIACQLYSDHTYYEEARKKSSQLANKHNDPSIMITDIENGIKQAIASLGLHELKQKLNE